MSALHKFSETCPSCGKEITGTGSTSDAAYRTTVNMAHAHILEHAEISPAPWSIQIINPAYPGAVRDAQNHCIARIGGVDASTRPYDMANMQLMAKAPEMRDHLAKVKTLLECYLSGEDIDDEAETTLGEVSTLLATLGIGSW